MSDTFHAELESRLTRYAAIDSQSDDEAGGSPSTAIQFDMLNLLKTELEQIGASDVQLTDYGTVLATIPGTAPGPTIGLLAHVDTAPQFNATGVKPRVIRGYNGGDDHLPRQPSTDPVARPQPLPRQQGRPRHHHRLRPHPARRR